MKTNNVKKGILFLGASLSLLMALFVLAACGGESASAVETDFPAAHHRDNREFRQLARQIIEDTSSRDVRDEMPEWSLEQEIVMYWILHYTEEWLDDLGTRRQEFARSIRRGLAETCPRLMTLDYFSYIERRNFIANVDINPNIRIAPVELGFEESEPAMQERLEYWFLHYAENLRINDPSVYYGFNGSLDVGPNLAALVHKINYGEDAQREMSDEELELLRWANWSPPTLSPEEDFERERNFARNQYRDRLLRYNLSVAERNRRLEVWEQNWYQNSDELQASRARRQAERDRQMEQDRNAANIGQGIANEVNDFWSGGGNAPTRHPNHIRWIRDSQGQIIGEERTTGTYLLTR